MRFSRSGSTTDLVFSAAATPRSHDAGHFVAVFASNLLDDRSTSSSSPIFSSSAGFSVHPDKTFSWESDFISQEEPDESHNYVCTSWGPRWVLRFQSNNEASALLTHLSHHIVATSSVATTNKVVAIWMVSDLGEIFRAEITPGQCMDRQSWHKVRFRLN